MKTKKSGLPFGDFSDLAKSAQNATKDATKNLSEIKTETETPSKQEKSSETENKTETETPSKLLEKKSPEEKSPTTTETSPPKTKSPSTSETESPSTSETKTIPQLNPESLLNATNEAGPASLLNATNGADPTSLLNTSKLPIGEIPLPGPAGELANKGADIAQQALNLITGIKPPKEYHKEEIKEIMDHIDQVISEKYPQDVIDKGIDKLLSNIIISDKNKEKIIGAILNGVFKHVELNSSKYKYVLLIGFILENPTIRNLIDTFPVDPGKPGILFEKNDDLFEKFKGEVLKEVTKYDVKTNEMDTKKGGGENDKMDDKTDNNKTNDNQVVDTQIVSETKTDGVDDIVSTNDIDIDIGMTNDDDELYKIIALALANDINTPERIMGKIIEGDKKNDVIYDTSGNPTFQSSTNTTINKKEYSTNGSLKNCENILDKMVREKFDRMGREIDIESYTEKELLDAFIKVIAKKIEANGETLNDKIQGEKIMTIVDKTESFLSSLIKMNLNMAHYFFYFLLSDRDIENIVRPLINNTYDDDTRKELIENNESNGEHPGQAKSTYLLEHLQRKIMSMAEEANKIGGKPKKRKTIKKKQAKHRRTLYKKKRRTKTSKKQNHTKKRHTIKKKKN